MVAGFIEGVLVLGLLMAFLFANPTGLWFESRLGKSNLSEPLIRLGSVFLPSVKNAVDSATNAVLIEKEIIGYSETSVVDAE